MSNQPHSVRSPSPPSREHDHIGADAPLYGCIIVMVFTVALAGALTWILLA
jgi:flagellin-like protein